LVSERSISIAAFPSTQSKSERLLAQVDRIVLPRRCALGRLPVSSRQGRSRLDSTSAKAGASDLHAASARKFEWLSLKYGTDLRPFHFDNVNKIFVDVYVSSNYLLSGDRHLAFPVSRLKPSDLVDLRKPIIGFEISMLA
jgi:hypothetical protein